MRIARVTVGDDAADLEEAVVGVWGFRGGDIMMVTWRMSKAEVEDVGAEGITDLLGVDLDDSPILHVVLVAVTTGNGPG